MTQKEFLKAFLEFADISENYVQAYNDIQIDKFLEQHLQEYFEVDHIRKDEEQIDHFTAQG